jgi:hypothetical protein
MPHLSLVYLFAFCRPWPWPPVANIIYSDRFVITPSTIASLSSGVCSFASSEVARCLSLVCSLLDPVLIRQGFTSQQLLSTYWSVSVPPQKLCNCAIMFSMWYLCHGVAREADHLIQTVMESEGSATSAFALVRSLLRRCWGVLRHRVGQVVCATENEQAADAER